MKVLFVEDENVKQSNIVTYLKDELGVENISVVNSLMGGMLALRNGKFDIVLLDMSLPLYDINGEDEELNEFEAFGGIEILDEIDRKELSVKVLVITAFDVIEDDTKKINLEQLDDQSVLVGLGDLASFCSFLCALDQLADQREDALLAEPRNADLGSHEHGNGADDLHDAGKNGGCDFGDIHSFPPVRCRWFRGLSDSDVSPAWRVHPCTGRCSPARSSRRWTRSPMRP